MSSNASYASWTTTKSATSPTLAILIVVNYVGTGYLVSGPDAVSDGVNAHLLDLFWSGTMALLLLGFHLLYRRRRRTSLMNYVAWLTSTLVASTVSLLSILALTGQMPNQAFMEQTASGVASMLATCFTFTMVITAITEGRGLRNSLRKTYSELTQTRESAVVYLEDYARKLATYSAMMLGKLMESVGPELAEAGSPAKVAAEISRLAGGDLRDSLSQIEQEKLSLDAAKRVRAKFPELRKVTTRKSTNLLGLYAIASLYLLPAALLLAGQEAMLQIALDLAITLTIQLLWFTLFGNREVQWVVLAGASSVLFAAVPIVVSLFWPVPGLAATSFAFSLGLIALLYTVVESTIVRRARVNAALEELNSALAESLVELERRVQQLKKSASANLHNDVQSGLLRLSLRLGSLEKFDESSLLSTREALDYLINKSTIIESAKLDSTTALTQLREFWEGALEITFELQPELAEKLNAEQPILARILEVTKEALTNAAKYSTDGRVELRISEPQSGRFELSVSNRFAPALFKGRVGLGSGIVAENATTWRHDIASDRFALVATFGAGI